MRDGGIIFGGQLSGDSDGAVDDTGKALTSDATDVDFAFVPENISIYEIGLFITVAVTTAAINVDFFDRPTPGTAVGEVLIGTVTTGATTAKGKVVRKLVSYKLAKGHIVHSVVRGSNGGAGSGVSYFKAYPSGQGLVEPVDVESAS